MAAYSRQAEEWGVRVGMPLAEASALAQRGGKFVALAHNPAADLTELARLAEMCERFSPLVGWQTVDASHQAATAGCAVMGPQEFPDWWPATGPDYLFLDITGIGRLFGGEEELIAEVRRDFIREGYEIYAAAANTIGAAWARGQESGVKGQESESSRKSTTSGFTLRAEDYVNPEASLPPAALPSPASCLPPSASCISSLRLPPETLSLLSQLGITRVEELLRLPRESLKSRFGERLLLRLDQTMGAAQEVIVPHHPPPRFQAEWILEFPTDSRELVEQIVSQLVERIALALAQRQEGVVQLACRLDAAGGQPLQLMAGLFRPSAQRQHLEELLAMQLEQAQLPRQIGRIGLAAQLTAPLENRQSELFAGSSRDVSREFALLVDRLSSRLGPQAVLQPVVRPDPLPERAVFYRAVVGKKNRRQGAGDRRRKRVQSSKFKVQDYSQSQISNLKSEIALLSPDSCLLTPVSCSLSPVPCLFLLHPPLPLAAVSVIPDGPPISFELEGRTHRIGRCWGPERIETGWWRGRSHRRDYYRVETTTGHRYWLFRRLSDGKWHLHGEYG